MPELTPALTPVVRSKQAVQFSRQVLDWFDQHGRKDLPWQHTINAYRVWISEIMLQQTQVNTVIPYFLRFMASFPTLDSLAAAPIDDVLHHWSGLGYYARARNLHKTAQTVRDQYNSELPSSVDELCELPGIGRSTAGAICAIAYQQKAAILDGNVKRVLARYHAIDGWPGQSKTSEQLWALAENYTPAKRVRDYTQAMMDLGATRCLRSKPLCEQCPLYESCQAQQLGDPSRYPGKKPKKTLPVKTVQMLLIEDRAGCFLLEKRPPQGIWGGLWSFPEIDSDASAKVWCEQTLQQQATQINTHAVCRHTFSHFHLDITPVHLRLPSSIAQIMEDDRQLWYNSAQPPNVGLAAPVSKLLAIFAQQKSENEVSHDKNRVLP